MRRPVVAPTPKPTTIAVGVANPRPQGQAIVSTVIEYWMAVVNITQKWELTAHACRYNNNIKEFDPKFGGDPKCEI